MDFALSEEQVAIFDMAREFGAEHIAPFARQWEAEGTIPRDLWPRLAELGFGGLYVSEEAGGAGLSRLDAALVFDRNERPLLLFRSEWVRQATEQREKGIELHRVALD